MSWKDILLENPWMPVRYLEYKYPEFHAYDLTNWLKKDNVKLVLDRDNWKLKTSGMSIDKTRRILTAIWKFYLENELSLDFENDEEIVRKLIKLTLDKQHPLAPHLVSKKYFEQSGYDYEKWTSKGYTGISFACFHFFPGKDWCDKSGILPPMFYQSSCDFGEENIIGLMDLIWLRHICKLQHNIGEDDIISAKKKFFVRHMDKDLIDRKIWSEFGLPNRIKNKIGIKKLEEMLSKKYGDELGYISYEKNSWSASKFRKDNPELSLSKCKYTDTFPVDLHHLLEREKFPEYMYHPENVVPLNTQVHALITRNKWSDEIKQKYKNCQIEWLKLKDDDKSTSVFDEVMRLLCKEVNSQ